MLNQAFNAENFWKILNFENRRGVYLEGEFFPDVKTITDKIKQTTAQLRTVYKSRRNRPRAEFEQERDALRAQRQELEREKETLLDIKLVGLSREVDQEDFTIGISGKQFIKGKQVYQADHTPAAYLALKQLQYNIRKLYNVKQANRHRIVAYLAQALKDNFPKCVIRTDIKDFYESVPCEMILKSLERDGQLTLRSRQIIRSIFDQYRKISQRPTGVPRGVGLSAYLVELFMKEFDKAICSHDERLFYSRYVDDVVVIFYPGPNTDATELLPFVRKAATNLGLSLNDDKTKTYDGTRNTPLDLEYLGYRFRKDGESFSVGLSDKRIAKYKRRIDRSFAAYEKRSAFGEKRARALLRRRIAFLTENTRLKNNKSNIMVGIFHSNRLLTRLGDLEELDAYLTDKVLMRSRSSLRNALAGFSFADGFRERRFRLFTSSQLKDLVELWKYEA